MCPHCTKVTLCTDDGICIPQIGKFLLEKFLRVLFLPPGKMVNFFSVDKFTLELMHVKFQHCAVLKVTASFT